MSTPKTPRAQSSARSANTSDPRFYPFGQRGPRATGELPVIVGIRWPRNGRPSRKKLDDLIV